MAAAAEVAAAHGGPPPPPTPAPPLVPALAPPPAAHQFDADQETDRGGADDQLLFVLLGLAAPVGHFGDLAAQRFDVRAKCPALGLDVAADLLRRAARLTGGHG